MTLPILEVHEAAKRYGGVMAVQEVSFDVFPGEIMGLIGPNGAGKTTLVNLITGVARPSHGSIAFEGRPLAGLRPHQIGRMGIARTFQVVRSFDSMSVAENVIVGALVRTPSAAEARRKAFRVLELTGLARRADAAAVELTPPEKRRLEIARALATEPKLLLLDEALTGLTPSEAQEGVELVRRIRAGGVTIVMVEHVMEVVMPLVDRAVVLDLGKVLAEGLPQEVVRDEKVIGAYLGDRHRAA